MVINYPQVIALSEIVPEPDVRRYQVGNVTVLKESVYRHFGIECTLYAETGNMCFKILIALGKTNNIDAIVAAQLEKT